MQVETLVVKIERDPALMARVALSPDLIAEYAEVMAADEAKGPDASMFPPVSIIRDADGRNYLVDGWHRLAAAEKAGLETFLCDIKAGTKEDALLAAAAANATNGQRRTDKDLGRCVALVCAVESWQQKGLREVAQHIGCGKDTVARWAKKLGIKRGVAPETPAQNAEKTQVSSESKKSNPFALPGPVDESGSVASKTTDHSGSDLSSQVGTIDKSVAKPKVGRPPKRKSEEALLAEREAAKAPKVTGADGKKYPAKKSKPEKSYVALSDDTLCIFRDMHDDWREQLRKLPSGTDVVQLVNLLDTMCSETKLLKSGKVLKAL